jgi:hypothetical protein
MYSYFGVHLARKRHAKLTAIYHRARVKFRAIFLSRVLNYHASREF